MGALRSSASVPGGAECQCWCVCVFAGYPGPVSFPTPHISIITDRPASRKLEGWGRHTPTWTIRQHPSRDEVLRGCAWFAVEGTFWAYARAPSVSPASRTPHTPCVPRTVQKATEGNEPLYLRFGTLRSKLLRSNVMLPHAEGGPRSSSLSPITPSFVTDNIQ